MDNGELTNENAFVYHISKISKSWSLSNPYFISLRDLLLNQKGTKLENIRKQQEYHFIAKIINNELNVKIKEINKNSKELLSSINKYLKEKQQKTGDIIIRDLFFIFILKLLDREKHFNKLDKDKIKNFLEEYKTQDNNLYNFHKVLNVLYLSKFEEQKENVIKDNVDLSVGLLYNRLILANNRERKNDYLVDYYLKQNSIENMDLTASSDSSKGRLLETALILKSASGKGLFLPEIEKEQYLSSFTQSIFREKYLKILDDLSHLKILKLRLPIWLTIILFFVLESVIFALPNWVDSISVGNLSIQATKLASLPIWVVLIINGLIIATFMYLIKNRINRRISEEKWK